MEITEIGKNVIKNEIEAIKDLLHMHDLIKSGIA
jgi:hypothetical protein